MPLRIQIARQLTARSDRVKCVDIHPTEPWILSALFNGNLYIWNYSTQQPVKSFEVTDLPVRAARFIARKGWIICGADDMALRVYNYNTMEKLKTMEAHSDYIRSVVVHPVQPYVLSSSDDMTIKLWDWDKNWQNTVVFEGHTHYVMQLAINPKDTNTFASASLDRSVKVWGFNSPNAHFTLEGHEKGVNCVAYALAGDKPYLVSGADDNIAKVWDYQNKTCVQTLEGHTHNVSVCCFHPEIPVIVTGSEDGTVKLWNANTYRLEKTLNYGMERVWTVAYMKGTNLLCLGYDDGTVMVKMGRDEPAMSMDPSGKLVWAKHNEVQMVNVKTASAAVEDGETLSLAAKDLGNCEVYPQSLQHNANGRFVVVCGDGEYIIYTALAWRNKAFGAALEFVWADGTGDYCVRESTSKIKFFKNFKESKAIRPDFSADAIFGGPLLSMRSSTFIVFYDWAEQRTIRRIDVSPKAVYWSNTGEVVVIACESSFYMLKYNKELVNQVLEAGDVPDDEGIEDAFEVLHEVGEIVKTGLWVGDCFVYTNNGNRLNYCVGSEIFNIAHLEKNMYLLGYIPKEGKLYVADKDVNVVAYTLHTSIINYQTAVLREDFDAAQKFLPKIPAEHRNRIAQFLESQGLKGMALEVSRDPDQRFELAMQLQKLDVALEIARESDTEQKWKHLSDAALKVCRFNLATQCMREAGDLNGLLLLHTSLGDSVSAKALAQRAAADGKNNTAFICHFLAGDVNACVDLLCATRRVPEAAFFARTYAPSRVSEIVKLWREDLRKVNERAADSLADPHEFKNLFPEFDKAVFVQGQSTRVHVDFSAYRSVCEETTKDVLEGVVLPVEEEVVAQEEQEEAPQQQDQQQDQQEEQQQDTQDQEDAPQQHQQQQQQDTHVDKTEVEADEELDELDEALDADLGDVLVDDAELDDDLEKELDAELEE